MEVTIRQATIFDSVSILNLIQELADYEKEPESVKLNISDIERHGFGETPLFRCLVAEFKNERVIFQTEAGKLIPEVKDIREALIKSGGMINLDPKWKKRKLLEQIEEIEEKIQTSALDHKSERKLLEKRRSLISENDKWVKDRKDSNPEMISYLDKNRKMSELFKKADKAHSKMIEAVTKAQPMYKKLSESSGELKEIKSMRKD